MTQFKRCFWAADKIWSTADKTCSTADNILFPAARILSTLEQVLLKEKSVSVEVDRGSVSSE